MKEHLILSTYLYCALNFRALISLSLWRSIQKLVIKTYTKRVPKIGGFKVFLYLTLILLKRLIACMLDSFNCYQTRSNVGTVLMMCLFAVKPNFYPYYIFWDRCQILTFSYFTVFQPVKIGKYECLHKCY